MRGLGPGGGILCGVAVIAGDAGTFVCDICGMISIELP